MTVACVCRVFQRRPVPAFLCQHDQWADHHRRLHACRHRKDKVGRNIGTDKTSYAWLLVLIKHHMHGYWH
jgi:hypothetical protein